MPVLFISAVSKELRSARQLVANTLTFLGYEPEWQDVFGTADGDLRTMLRRRIDASHGVVQLVGNAYGAEPPAPDETFGRVSYSQFEALYARSRGKRVWYLFLDEGFPADAHEPEPEELRALQARYREALRADAHLFHPLHSPDALKVAVHEMRNDLARLRRGMRVWAWLVAALLVIAVGLGAWVLLRQHRAAETIEDTNRALASLRSELARFYVDAAGRSRQEASGVSYSVPNDQTATLDAERDAIEADRARLAAEVAQLNTHVDDLSRQGDALDPSDPVALERHNTLVSQHNALVSSIRARQHDFNVRVDAYHERLAKAGTRTR